MASSCQKDIVLAFDLYGTILSTSSTAKELAKHFGEEKAAQVAETWRTLQLEYTWRLNSMEQYQPFTTITQSSLHAALHTHSLSLPPHHISTLLTSYNTLDIFPDVSPALDALSSQTSASNPASNPTMTFKPYIFSNAPYSSLQTSLHHSPSLSPHAHLFADLISVEDTRRFKPHPAVYRHLLERVGKRREEAGEAWLVSGNPFDVVGARALGLRAAWVDRDGSGWADGLVRGEEGRPDLVVRGLREVRGAVERWVGEKKAGKENGGGFGAGIEVDGLVGIG